MNVFNTASAKASGLVIKSIAKLRHVSPEILMGMGIAAGGLAIYEACKATYNGLDDILKNTEEELEQVKRNEQLVNDGVLNEEAFTKKDAMKSRARIKLRTVGKLAVHYKWALVCWMISVACISGGNHIQSTRNAVLATSLAAEEEWRQQYQRRALDEFGEEAERRIRYDIHDDESTIEEVDEETGEIVETKVVNKDIPHAMQPHAFVFDDKSPYFKNNRELDSTFLRLSEDYICKVLDTRRTYKKPGVFFADEFLRDIGVKPEDIGMNDYEAHLWCWCVPPKGVGADEVHHVDLGLGTWSDANSSNGYSGIVVHMNFDGMFPQVLERFKK